MYAHAPLSLSHFAPPAPYVPRYCGMCHSDLHTVDGSWGVNKYPIAVGHELGGIVAAVGANAAAKFKVGDKVAVGCMVMSCQTCGLCDEGLEQHCPVGPTQIKPEEGFRANEDTHRLGRLGQL